MKILNYSSLNISYTYSVDHFVRGGETLSSDSMDVFSGGKGLNQSITLSRSGAEVWHAGVVGAGDGDFLVRQLQSAGVNTELIAVLEGKAGHAIIQKAKDGGSCILLYNGTNREITKSMVDEAMGHFEAGDYLVLQSKISEIGYIMEKAHEKQIKIVLNPSPTGHRTGEYPLEYVDYFLLNGIETGDICNEQGEGEALLRKLSARFPGVRIVLTPGGDGSLYWDGERLLKQGIYKMEVVDIIAAGDTFTGFFIGGLVQGMNAAAALEWAAKAAAITVSRQGVALSIPSRDKVDGF